MSTDPMELQRRISSLEPELIRTMLHQSQVDLIEQISTSTWWISVDYAQLTDPQFAYKTLDQARQMVEAAITPELPRHSPLAWLFLLRELPDPVFGWENSTLLTSVILRDLCEFFTAAAPARFADQEVVRASAGLVFTPNLNGVAALLRVVAGVQLLKRLHARLRAAAKGIAFRPSNVFSPVPAPTSTQRSAIELYDERIQRPSEGTLLHSGVDLMDPGDILGAAIPESILVVSRLPRSAWLDIPELSPHPIRGAFSVAAPSVGPLATFNQAKAARVHSWYGPHAPSLMALLYVALRLILDKPGAEWSAIVKGCLHFPNRAALSQVASGHYDGARQVAEAVFAPACLPNDFDAMLKSLELVQPSVWPMRPGKITRVDGEVIALDLYAASRLFNEQLIMPVMGGSFDNTRADLFEKSTQAVIDASPWGNLSSSLRGLRGRTLVDDANKPITDVDALGCRGRTLLLVDCLSHIPDLAANNVGNYRAYRNAASRVEDKVAGDAGGRRPGWRAKVSRLVGRRGPNFDFTAYDSAIAVVVTPYPVYVEASLIGRPTVLATTEVAPGLLGASTQAELAEWLEVAPN